MEVELTLPLHTLSDPDPEPPVLPTGLTQLPFISVRSPCAPQMPIAFSLARMEADEFCCEIKATTVDWVCIRVLWVWARTVESDCSTDVARATSPISAAEARDFSEVKELAMLPSVAVARTVSDEMLLPKVVSAKMARACSNRTCDDTLDTDVEMLASVP